MYSRNTSVDESYEFDATECQIGLDLLEAMKMKQAGMRQAVELRHDRPLTSTGLQDLQEKGEGPFNYLSIYTYTATVGTNVTSVVLFSCSLLSSLYLLSPQQAQTPSLVFPQPPRLLKNSTVVYLVRHVLIPLCKSSTSTTELRNPSYKTPAPFLTSTMIQSLPCSESSTMLLALNTTL